MKFEKFFAKATGTDPYPYQAKFATSDALPHLLEVPTGSGKTATAVLGWLWRRRHGSPAIRRITGRRLVFCLPMRTLVEQTAQACRKWLGALGLTDDVPVWVLQGGSIARDWDEAPERDSIVIGTQDQLLSRALNRGYAMSRFRWPIHFGWLNNDCVWVLDEIQLMGSGLSTSAQLHALREAFGAFGPVHTVWMSATVAPGILETVDLRKLWAKDEPRRQGLEAEDRKALDKRLKARKPLSALAHDPKKPGATAKKIAELHAKGTLTLVVVNQVARARELVEAFAKLGVTAELIHSRFRPHERRQTSSRALDPKFDGILVATQAIEAGVDIDARLLVTELASWSSLVQRFGRCNRAGQRKDASVLWLDVASKDKEARPYTVEELDVARARLEELEDVGAARLAAIGIDPVRPALPVLRRTDLFALFDTQADLAGHDIDVSGYVRTSEHDSDVQVFWRAEASSAEMKAPHPDELCRVPVEQLRSLLGKDGRARRWSSLRNTWEDVRERDLHPGLTLLLTVEQGGYSPTLGWTGNAADKPTEVPLPSDAEALDADDGDPWTHQHRYVELAVHSGDVVDAVGALHDSLAELAELPWPALQRAARWHDLGKAHAAFQAMLIEKLPDDDERRDGRVWAKSDGEHAGRCERSHFRHELASALAFMDQGGDDLEVYLVAAHHGKVRMAIRSRPNESPPRGEAGIDRDRAYALGVWDGDELPRVELGGGVVAQGQRLSLDVMKLGRQSRDGERRPSWTERSLALLDEFGPFRLAYLEALLRIADWRGTRVRMGGEHG